MKNSLRNGFAPIVLLVIVAVATAGVLITSQITTSLHKISLNAKAVSGPCGYQVGMQCCDNGGGGIGSCRADLGLQCASVLASTGPGGSSPTYTTQCISTGGSSPVGNGSTTCQTTGCPTGQSCIGTPLGYVCAPDSSTGTGSSSGNPGGFPAGPGGGIPAPGDGGTTGGTTNSDTQYIGGSCQANDGSSGTCEYVTDPNGGSCTDKYGTSYTHESGHCGGSSNVQCCFKPGTGGSGAPTNSGGGGTTGGAGTPSTSGGFGQGPKCDAVKGTCQNDSSACGGAYQSNLCPGPSYWRCCVPPAAGGGSAPSTGTNGAAQEAACVAQNGQCQGGAGDYGSACTVNNAAGTYAQNLCPSQPLSVKCCVPLPGSPPPAAPPPPQACALNTPPSDPNAGRPLETSCLKPLLRYFNVCHGDHFYTSNWDELKSGTTTWKLEGTVGYVESPDTPHCYAKDSQPLYRFFNNSAGVHFYQLNSATSPTPDWILEGIAGHINPAADATLNTTVLERFFNGSTADHFYTNNVAESDALKANGQGYIYEFPAGYTYSDVALSNAAQPTKFTGYKLLALSCTDGFAATASYEKNPANPTLPHIQYVVELVKDSSEAGLGNGTLIEQSEESNGATFYSANVVKAAIGRKIQFYLYSVSNNAEPKTSYTIFGTDGASNKEVSKQPGETPPTPYTLECPQTTLPPPTGGDKTPGGDNGGAVSDKKEKMTINVSVAIPQQVLGKQPKPITIVPPVIKTIPVEFTFIDYAHNNDETKQTIDVNFQPDGEWTGVINASLYPSDKYVVKVWGPKHGIKTICATGPYTPMEMYPTTYRCTEKDASISLKAGNNTLDFSRIVLPPGDVKVNGVRDGRVDAQDLKVLRGLVGKTDQASIETGDLDYNGKVDEYDPNYIIWSIEQIP